MYTGFSGCVLVPPVEIKGGKAPYLSVKVNAVPMSMEYVTIENLDQGGRRSSRRLISSAWSVVSICEREPNIALETIVSLNKNKVILFAQPLSLAN